MAAAAATTSQGQGVAFANGDPRGHAPVYPIPDTKITALEHPMIIKDVDKAIQTFGRNPNLSSVSASVPLLFSHAGQPLSFNPDHRRLGAARLGPLVSAL